MSVLSQRHSIIFDRGISAPGHGKEVVDGINSIDKRCMYQLDAAANNDHSNRLIEFKKNDTSIEYNMGK